MTIPVLGDTHLDICPLCDANLDMGRGKGTRRQPILTTEPRRFRWRCPDCRGVWQVNTPCKDAFTVLA